METVVCDLCGHNQTHPVYSVKDTNYGTLGTFTLVQCQYCGLVYLNPRPARADFTRIYSESRYDPYRAAFDGQHLPNQAQVQRARWLTTQQPAGRVLEVGFGSGLFLKAMREQGWHCNGVEPNATTTQFAREQLQLDVEVGDIFSVTRRDFDLIAMWDVLEHTPSPRQNLLHAFNLLKPSGRLVLSFPNWTSIERRVFKERWIALDAPRHFYHFSQATISRLLRECGFEILSVSATAPVMSLASNTLRWLGDLALRSGQAKALQTLDAQSEISQSSVPARPASIKELAIRVTYFALTPLNVVFNALERGPNLTVLAIKPP